MEARRLRSLTDLKVLALASIVIGTAALGSSSCLASSVNGYATGGGGPGHTSTNEGGSNNGTGANGGGNGGNTSSPNGGGGGCSGMICGSDCVDLQTNPKHCGSCDNACTESFGCSKGLCDNVPVKVLAGGLVSCVILNGGDLYCMGRDVYFETGIDPADATETCSTYAEKCLTKPTKVAITEPVVDVGSGSQFTCALTKAGKVYCFGDNANGRLGHNPANDPTCIKAWQKVENPKSKDPCRGPTKVDLPPNVMAVQMAVGVGATCVRSQTDDVYCWGDNTDGVVEAPNGGFQFKPVQNANVHSDAIDIALGSSAEAWNTACVVRKTTHFVDCWGESAGSIFVKTGGANCTLAGTTCDPVAHPVPTDFAAQTGHLTADKVQIGYITGCALESGKVSCWGNNQFGQFGNGSWADGRFNPIAVGGMPNTITQLSMTFATNLAVGSPGDVYAVGWNGIGQIGDGTDTGTACRPAAVQSICVETTEKLSTLSKVIQVSAGSQSSAALTSDRKVYVWGTNLDGEQGHKPGLQGDAMCGPNEYCNFTPQLVPGLP
jgi:alpha-tubulin suppressor-like RCC1 family protein